MQQPGLEEKCILKCSLLLWTQSTQPFKHTQILWAAAKLHWCRPGSTTSCTNNNNNVIILKHVNMSAKSGCHSLWTWINNSSKIRVGSLTAADHSSDPAQIRCSIFFGYTIVVRSYGLISLKHVCLFAQCLSGDRPKISLCVWVKQNFGIMDDTLSQPSGFLDCRAWGFI